MQASVLSEQKISDTTGGLGGVLTNGDEFGYAADSLGDLDGDGIVDLAVSTRNDNDGGMDRGSLWILFMNSDGTVASKQKISDTAGGFTGTLDDNDTFGSALAGLGDLDGDGVEDLAVGARFDDDGGANRGAVWILFLHADGTVKSHQKISDTAGGFTGILDDSDQFGTSLAVLGDLDGDGIVDLAVGANLDDDGGVNRGAVWVLFLDEDGTVKSHQKISDTAGGFSGVLDVVDQFGASLAALGDLDHDGSEDLAVGAVGDNDGGEDCGAVWVLFLDTDGTVKSQQKISDIDGNFAGTLDDFDQFGSSLESCDDIDFDGRPELAVGAIGDDDGDVDQGATWLLFLKADGTVASERKISATSGGFGGDLDSLDNFGISGVALGDLDGNGIQDLGVGAHRDDDGGSSAGALWVLFLGLDPDPPVILCSEDITAELTGPAGAVVTYDVSAVDEVDSAPILVCTPESGSTFPPGTTTVAVTATDTSGNVSTCFFDVTVADTTPPVIACPSDVTVECTSPAGESVSFFPSATDIFDSSPSIVAVPGSGSTFPLGTTTVTLTATDDAGNSSTCFFDVTVADTTPPDIACPLGITAECTSPAGASVGFAPTASDLGDPALDLVAVPASGSTFPLGTTTVTVTATDDAGNSSTCTFDVTVQDTTPPVITCPADIVKRSATDGGWLVSFAPSASDLGDPTPTVLAVPPSGSFFPIGTTTVVCTATDDAGNSSTCSFDVVVKRKTRFVGPPLSIVLLTTPFELTEPEQGEQAETPEWLDFTVPPGEPLLLLDVAGTRVDLTDGVVSHVLYEQEPEDEGLSLSVYADLSLLFPLATGDTVFQLTGAKNLRFHGGSKLRNGSGVNEVSFISACTPRAGADWQVWVDVSGHPDARASIVIVSARPLTGRPSPFGEILIDVLSRRPLFTNVLPSSGATDVHAFPIPAEVLGMSFSLQGLILDPSRNALTNAVDIKVGHLPE